MLMVTIPDWINSPPHLSRNHSHRTICSKWVIMTTFWFVTSSKTPDSVSLRFMMFVIAGIIVYWAVMSDNVSPCPDQVPTPLLSPGWWRGRARVTVRDLSVLSAVTRGLMAHLCPVSTLRLTWRIVKTTSINFRTASHSWPGHPSNRILHLYH